jgi:predicted transcriptional regulator
MSKEAVFTLKLETDLRADFMAEAEAAHRSASQVVRELMRDFVQRQRQARDYQEFLGRKVEAGRVSMRASKGHCGGVIYNGLAAAKALKFRLRPSTFGLKPVKSDRAVNLSFVTMVIFVICVIW